MLVLAEGRLEAAGTLDDLLAACAEMRRLWQGDLGPVAHAPAPVLPVRS